MIDPKEHIRELQERTPRALFGDDPGNELAKAAGWRFETDEVGYNGNPPAYYAISPEGYVYKWENCFRHGGADPWSYCISHMDFERERRFNYLMWGFEEALTALVTAHPEKYWYKLDKVPEVVAKFRVAVLEDTCQYDGEAMKAACKRLGIKATRKAILDFLSGKTDIKKLKPDLTCGVAGNTVVGKYSGGGHVIQ